MKKKGFTLIELIVVIAIIGVLAAILVPAMLGYVKKSKITSANSSAKSIFTACQSALTDMDTEDKARISNSSCSYVSSGDSWYTNSDMKATKGKTLQGAATAEDKQFMYKVYTYFNDITKLTAVAVGIKAGTCECVAVTNGNYPGCTSNQFSVDDYNSSTNYTSVITQVLGYGKTGTMGNYVIS